MNSPPPAQDSVGVVETQTMRLTLPQEGFALQEGGVLSEIDVAYEVVGRMEPDQSNVIFICHALTGDAHVAGTSPGAEEPDGWWEGMVGPGKGIDTNYYAVICANILGGCKGTTGPSSINPATGNPYGSSFPSIRVRDIVKVQKLFLEQLGINHVTAVIGGSFGGMQVLEWAIRYPDFIGRGLVIASAASLNAQALAFDIIGRRSITEDPRWRLGNYYGAYRKPKLGLGQARRLAHITYLSGTSMADKFGRARRREWVEGSQLQKLKARLRFRSTFEVESYLDHQARKFTSRFDANSYLHITRAMDEFDLEEEYGSLEKALEKVKAPLLVVSLSGDWLFQAEQSEAIVKALLAQKKEVSYFHLKAPAGHDAFLTHIDQLSQVIRAFLPWIGGAPAVSGTEEPLTASAREAFQTMRAMIPPGARLLDLGCGDGNLMRFLKRERGACTTGMEVDFGSALAALDGGSNVLLDIPSDAHESIEEEGLSLIPDDSFDFVLLSETLQVMRRPKQIVAEVLRIAREAIVYFPNFGYLPTRLKLLFSGRMPKNRHLPYEWYNTPNIHLFTYKDFQDLARRSNFTISEVKHLASTPLGRSLIAFGLTNLGAERVIVHVERGTRDN